MTGCDVMVYYCLVHTIWKCFILIGWWVLAIFEQFMLNCGHGVTRLCLTTGTIPVENDFPWRLYLWNIFSRVICLYVWQIDGAVVCVLLAVSMTKLGNFVIIIIMLNLSVFCFSFMMIYYLLSILLSSPSETIPPQTTR